ncbi:3-hydroxyacyl-ACP dehydratase [Parapedobacter pyrenivorans]|uniref:3-hydroxyacyl-ACP dehydratase n=1 Tax=Parapedobacter pyrenivorans TaxID=1305674 RepID=UPI00166CAFAC|nr:3-hydroxyacyl-ACP dehydratase [Parapedobacter pyrenivorans]
MSLFHDFYSIAAFTADGPKVSASISINKTHPVFKGHFPNNPVTPGVCMMQIIKELAEKWAECSLVLKKARNVKFMAIINPDNHPNIQVELDVEEEDGLLSVRSTTSFEDTMALKFSGVFQKV